MNPQEASFAQAIATVNHLNGMHRRLRTAEKAIPPLNFYFAQ